MKKRTILAYAAILMMLWGTSEMSAYHFTKASDAITHFRHLAQS